MTLRLDFAAGQSNKDIRTVPSERMSAPMGVILYGDELQTGLLIVLQTRSVIVNLLG